MIIKNLTKNETINIIRFINNIEVVTDYGIKLSLGDILIIDSKKYQIVTDIQYLGHFYLICNVKLLPNSLEFIKDEGLS